MKFKDHFSGHAANYAKFRPNYPRELFEYLASIAPGRGRAWDCATGNGQAAVGLSAFFECIIATDASERQILGASRNERIEFRVAVAEKSGLESKSIDLVTVAQALHWFDLDAFYAEAIRVLKPRGILAAWCYNLLEIAPEIDAIITRFYDEIVGPYWPPERKIVEGRYRTIRFPFDELEPPAFVMQAHWSLEQLLGYLRTWSATQAFITAHGSDPTEAITADLSGAWGKATGGRIVRWPLSIRVGCVVPAV